MYKTEEVFSGIISIKDETGCTLGEAVLAYAEQADCEPEEVIKALDPTAVSQIRESLRNSEALKPSMRGRPQPQLVF